MCHLFFYYYYPVPIIPVGSGVHVRYLSAETPVFVFQVLVSVGCQIEQYAASRPEFAQMVRDAGQYLLLKDQALKDRGKDYLNVDLLVYL